MDNQKRNLLDSPSLKMQSEIMAGRLTDVVNGIIHTMNTHKVKGADTISLAIGDIQSKYNITLTEDIDPDKITLSVFTFIDLLQEQPEISIADYRDGIIEITLQNEEIDK